jgi:hypothetical protein
VRLRHPSLGWPPPERKNSGARGREKEVLCSRVSELKGRFAKQKVRVKLEHYWELEYVRTRFTEFKRRVEDLENAGDGIDSRYRWKSPGRT